MAGGLSHLFIPRGKENPMQSRSSALRICFQVPSDLCPRSPSRPRSPAALMRSPKRPPHPWPTCPWWRPRTTRRILTGPSKAGRNCLPAASGAPRAPSISTGTARPCGSPSAAEPMAASIVRRQSGEAIDPIILKLDENGNVIKMFGGGMLVAPARHLRRSSTTRSGSRIIRTMRRHRQADADAAPHAARRRRTCAWQRLRRVRSGRGQARRSAIRCSNSARMASCS